MTLDIQALAGRGAEHRPLAAADRGCAAALAGCNTTQHATTTGGIPNDYRAAPSDRGARKARRTVELFVGASRGGLTPTQRAEVLAFAQNWKREATGGVIIDRAGRRRQRARRRRATREDALSILAAGRRAAAAASRVRPYQPGDPASSRPCGSTIRGSTAEAGPCGLWPRRSRAELRRASISRTANTGISAAPSQRNLAAMVANPADLVQPRAEDAGLHRRAAPPCSTSSARARARRRPTRTPNKGEISDVGK